MNIRLIVITLLIVIPSYIYGQYWTREYSEIVQSVSNLHSISDGYTASYLLKDGKSVIVTFDANANIKSIKKIFSDSQNRIMKVLPQGDGFMVLYSSGILRMVNKDCTSIWDRTLSMVPTDFLVLPDNFYLVSGRVKTIGGVYKNAFALVNKDKQIWFQEDDILTKPASVEKDNDPYYLQTFLVPTTDKGFALGIRSPEGSTLSLHSSNGKRLWTKQIANPIKGLALSNSGNAFMLIGDKPYFTWVSADNSSNMKISRPLESPWCSKGNISSIIVSDKGFLSVGSYCKNNGGETVESFVVEINDTGKVLSTYFVEFSGREAMGIDVVTSPDGNTILGRVMDTTVSGEYRAFLAGNGKLTNIYLSQEKAVMIYPNPVVSTSTINFSLPINGVSIIYDIHGREVLKIPIKNGEGTIERSYFSAGVYILRLEALNSEYRVKLFFR